MVNDPTHPVGAGIQERYDRIAQIVDGPTREQLIDFLKGEGPSLKMPLGWRHAFRVFADPIPMVLHCPACGAQHIDEATAEWNNPPHRSHLCGSCGCIWRPADIATVGVEAITTAGSDDNWPLIKEASERDEGDA